MKVIKLKDLKSIVEGVSSEFLELAYKSKGTQAAKIDPQTGKEIIPKFRPFWKEGNESEIPDYWILNPTQQEGKDMLVVPLDCVELESFMEENGEWLDQIAEQHGLDPDLKPKCKRTKYAPRNKEVGTSYAWSGVRQPLKESIKRDLHAAIVEVLGTEAVSKKLEKCSIPEIKPRDKKHLNRYGQMDNEKIVYGTHTFNSYFSSKQFLKFVTARITGKEVEEQFKSYHLARQFNTIYRKWYETKKNDKQYQGKTEAYMLEKFGLDPDNLDVTVRTDFKVLGNNMINTKKYTWTVTLKTKFGRKLTEDVALQGGLSLDKELTVSKEFDYELEKDDQGNEIPFSQTNTVLDNFSIKNGLIEVLSDMENKIMTELKPVDALKLANIKNFDISKKSDTNV